MEIGSRLRDARRAADADLIDCEAATKIRAKYLMALEEEDFSILPEPVFVRGMLRTYAQWLGIDPAPLLQAYAERTGEPVDPATGPPAPTVRSGRPRPMFVTLPRVDQRRSRRRDGRLVAFAIGGLLVVAGLVWLGSRARDDGGTRPPTVPAAAGGARVSTVPVVTGSGNGTATPAPVLVIMGTSASGADVQVHRVDAEGPLVFKGRLAQGQRRRVAVSGPLWVHIAPGGTVAARLDGRGVRLPSGNAGTVVDADGVRRS